MKRWILGTSAVVGAALAWNCGMADESFFDDEPVLNDSVAPSFDALRFSEPLFLNRAHPIELVVRASNADAVRLVCGVEAGCAEAIDVRLEPDVDRGEWKAAVALTPTRSTIALELRAESAGDEVRRTVEVPVHDAMNYWGEVTLEATSSIHGFTTAWCSYGTPLEVSFRFDGASDPGSAAGTHRTSSETIELDLIATPPALTCTPLDGDAIDDGILLREGKLVVTDGVYETLPAAVGGERIAGAGSYREQDFVTVRGQACGHNRELTLRYHLQRREKTPFQISF